MILIGYLWIQSIFTLPYPKPIQLPLYFNSKLYKRSESLEIPLFEDLDLSLLGIKVNIGTPAQSFLLLFDTGSADTWVPSLDCKPQDGCPNFLHRFQPQISTSYQAAIEPHKELNITYGIGSAEGHYMTDTLNLLDQPKLSIPNQTLGMIDRMTGPISQQQQIGLDGIFGAGFPEGTIRHLRRQTPYPPFIFSLYQTGQIPDRLFSVKLKEGETSLVLGKTHEVKIPYIYTDVVGSSWTVHLESIAFKNASLTKTFAFNVLTPFGIDTGSNFMYLPKAMALDLARVLSDGTASVEKDGLVSIDCGLMNQTSSISFYLPESRSDKRLFMSLSMKDLMAKRKSDGLCFFLFIPSDDKFILGNMFLKHFITVFDFNDPPRIGFSPV